MNYYYNGHMTGGKIPHKRTRRDGEEFDSKAEARRYEELKLMQTAGEIRGLKCHPSWTIIPAQRDAAGKCIFKAAKYTADFSYLTKGGELVVEDVKSEYTRREKDYILRRKLMYARYGIYVREIVK